MRGRVSDNVAPQPRPVRTGLRMKDYAALAVILFSVAMLTSCVEPRFATLTIHEDTKSIVRLYVLTDSSDSDGFSHPIDIHERLLSRIMGGLIIEQRRLFSSERYRAFNKADISFFAPLLAKGLSQATSDEAVAFLSVTEASEKDWRITSGAVFVKDQDFFILLSNHQERVNYRLDIDEFFRHHPLEPMDPDWTWPADLHFAPEEYAGSADDTRIETLTPEDTLLIGVRFRELARASDFE